MKDTNSLNLILKTFSILDYLNEKNEPVGISSVSKDLNIPKANVFRILKTLNNISIVEESEAGFTIGTSILKYGKTYRDKNKLINICNANMIKLADEIGETVNLGILYNNQVLFLKTVFGEDSSIVSHLVPISPLHCSSMGKIFLSHMDEEQVKTYFNSPLQKYTVNTLTAFNEFLEEKNFILKNNYSLDLEEYEYGLSCIATPIYNKNKEVIGALSISGPTTRLQYKNFDNLILKIKDLGQLLSSKVSESFSDDFNTSK